MPALADVDVEARPLARALAEVPSRAYLESVGVRAIHARRTSSIELDPDALGGGLPPEREGPPPRIAPQHWLDLELFPGESLRVRGLRLEDSAGGGQTWVGEVEGASEDGSGHLILTWQGGSVYGNAHVDLRHYQLRSGSDGRVHVLELDPSSYPGDGCGLHEEAVEGPAGKRGGDSALALESLGPMTPAAGLKDGTPNTTLDILIAYTQRVGVAENPIALGDNLVAGLNQAFQSTGVTATVNVAGYVATDYDELGKEIQEIREEMPFSAYGGFAHLALARDHYKADLVVLLFDLDSSAQNACGAAQRPPLLTQAGANHYRAVVGADCADSPAYTFAHEVGHTLGGEHSWGYLPSRVADLRTNPPYDTMKESVWQAFSEAHFRPLGHDENLYYDENELDYDQGGSNKGMRLPALGTYTLMGADQDCTLSGCPRLLRWSNPDQTYSGYDLGVPTSAPCTHTTQPDEDWSVCHADMRVIFDFYVPIAADHKTPGYSAPGQLDTLTVTPAQCYGLNDMEWSIASGTIGWYEIESKPSAGSTWTQLYKGTGNGFVFNVLGTTNIRGRACNSQGCGSWLTGGNATYTNGCL